MVARVQVVLPFPQEPFLTFSGWEAVGQWYALLPYLASASERFGRMSLTWSRSYVRHQGTDLVTGVNGQITRHAKKGLVLDEAERFAEIAKLLSQLELPTECYLCSFLGRQSTVGIIHATPDRESLFFSEAAIGGSVGMVQGQPTVEIYQGEEFVSAQAKQISLDAPDERTTVTAQIDALL